MVYVRPTSKKSTSGGPVASSDSDYLAVDHDHIAENSPLVATKVAPVVALSATAS